MKNKDAGIVSGLLVAIIIFLCIFGYVTNIVKLTKCDFKEPYKAEIIHTVGLIPAIGCITGYLDCGK